MSIYLSNICTGSYLRICGDWNYILPLPWLTHMEDVYFDTTNPLHSY